MISELILIRNYTNFWRTLFPGGEDYVRLINSALGVKFAYALEFNDIPQRRSLINNISFSLFELSVKQGISTDEINNFTANNDTLKSIHESEMSIINKWQNSNDIHKDINEEELKVIKNISIRLILKYSKEPTLKIRPTFKGCGTLFEATGDVIYKDVLTEVKAGDRNFSIQDIRQLYVYLALNHQANGQKFHKMEIFNPRTGVVWNEFIDTVSDNIAGSSTIEVYNEIIEFVSNEYQSI